MNIEIDLTKEPKEFCEGIIVGFKEDAFALGLQSGEEISAYALTPAHMKKFQQYITHQIAEYEKNFGEIKVQPWESDDKTEFPFERQDK